MKEEVKHDLKEMTKNIRNSKGKYDRRGTMIHPHNSATYGLSPRSPTNRELGSF